MATGRVPGMALAGWRAANAEKNMYIVMGVRHVAAREKERKAPSAEDSEA